MSWSCWVVSWQNVLWKPYQHPNSSVFSCCGVQISLLRAPLNWLGYSSYPKGRGQMSNEVPWAMKSPSRSAFEHSTHILQIPLTAVQGRNTSNSQNPSPTWRQREATLSSTRVNPNIQAPSRGGNTCSSTCRYDKFSAFQNQPTPLCPLKGGEPI